MSVHFVQSLNANDCIVLTLVKLIISRNDFILAVLNIFLGITCIISNSFYVT